MKAEILSLAMRQMKAGGYHRLNFAQIAEELGTTRANLHHHFKNKEGLGLAATEQYISEQRDAMEAIFARHEDDILSILHAIECYLIDLALETDFRCSCICTQLIYETEAPEQLRSLALARFREEERTLETILRGCLNTGNLQIQRTPSQLAASIAATMFGFAQLTLIEPNKTKLTNQIKGALTSIVS